MSAPVSTPNAVTSEALSDPYLPIEEVARRLDLPLSILIHRAEAGDIPARRVDTPDGPRFSVRLGDLGVERDTGPLADGPPVAGGALDVLGTPQSWGGAAPPPLPFDAATRAAPEFSNGAADTGSDILLESDPPALVPAVQPETRIAAEPRREIAGMTLDPRELVAGLLERWERTLEQRIYAEQRQRFEAELNARQNLVRQLQLELQTVRAENAASLAERDRRLADSERTIAQLRGELDEMRGQASRRRNWPFRH